MTSSELRNQDLELNLKLCLYFFQSCEEGSEGEWRDSGYKLVASKEVLDDCTL